MKRNHLGLRVGLGAIAVAAAIALGIVMTHRASGSAAAPIAAAAQSSPQAQTAPAWLQKSVAGMTDGWLSSSPAPGASPEPTTSYWVLTTAGAYAKVTEQGPVDAAYRDKPLYVVVVNGDFGLVSHSQPYRATPPAEPEPHDRQVFVVYDAQTHEVDGTAIMKVQLDASGLGDLQPLAL